VVFLTSGELGLKDLPPEQARMVREKEAEEAAQVIGIADLTFLRRADWFLADQIQEAGEALGVVMDKEAPQTVYLPHRGEWHPDHACSLAVLRSALAGSQARPDSLLTYEVWTPMQEYSRVEDTSAVIGRKLRAVRCYASQLRGFRYDRAVLGLGAYRGALAARCPYAEVFGQVETNAQSNAVDAPEHG